jgi:hypothetical protein
MLATLPLKKMTLEEKFITIETIWDDIVRNSPNFPSPAWHGDVLKERDALLESGEDKLMDWELAKESLRNSLK